MISGIHHVTAMCGDPQANVDFYSGLLGLRMVKVNVNMDDPTTYHLYYGDAKGSPGTAMTFFPWPNVPRGVTGRGHVAATAFAVPVGSLEFWRARIPQATEFTRFGQPGLAFTDPDGLHIELIESEDERTPWEGNGVAAGHAITGFHSVTLWSDDSAETTSLLTEEMGFRLLQEEDGRQRYAVGEGDAHQLVDVADSSGRPRGRMGIGTHHHVAFRVADDEAQAEISASLSEAGLGVTSVQERFYFRSVYFREPGHILFEIATDEPGFTADEPVEHLGERLTLPPWFESKRGQIEAALPKFTTPNGVVIP